MKQRFLSLLLLATMATAIHAAEYYGFYVGGVKVTSENYQNISTSDISFNYLFASGQDFGVSYNPATKTLTLTNVFIKRTGSSNYCIKNESCDGLNVVFKGRCELDSEDEAIRLTANTTFSGDEVSIYGNDGSIYMDNSAVLVIKDMKLMEIGSYTSSKMGWGGSRRNWYSSRTSKAPIDGDGNESVIIRNSYVHLDYGTSDGCLHHLNSLSLNNSTLTMRCDQSGKQMVQALDNLTCVGDMKVVYPEGVSFNSSKRTLVDRNGNNVVGNTSGQYVVFKAMKVALNATNFPDEDFREYICHEFDSDYYEGETGFFGEPAIHGLTQQEINACTTMNTRNYHYIANLKGIEWFTQLSELDLSYNEMLMKLELSSLPSLTKLVFTQTTAISQLTLSNLPNLTTLDCYTNVSLNKIRLSNVPNLNYILCDRNHLDAEATQLFFNDLPTITNGTGIIGYNDARVDVDNAYPTAEQLNALSNKGWQLRYCSPSGLETIMKVFDFKVGGTQFTNLMVTRPILTCDALTSGYLRYDASSKTLFLQDAVISSSNSCIEVGPTMSGFKIRVLAPSTLNLTTAGRTALDVRNGVGTSIEGAKLTINVPESTSTSAALYLSNRGGSTNDYRFTIKDCIVNINGPAFIGGDNGDNNLTLDNVALHMTNGYISTGNDLQLNNCHIVKPTGGHVSGGNICAAGSNGYFTGEIEILQGSGLLRGDLNGDGLVDVTDVSILIDLVLGKTSPDLSPQAQPDLNGDGLVDVTDVSTLIDIVLGK